MAQNPFSRSRSVSESVSTMWPALGLRRPGGLMSFSGKPPPVWLLCHPTMAEVAGRVVERCSATSSPRTRQAPTSECREVEFKDIIRWGKFNDGFPNIFIDEVKDMAGKDVLLLVSFHSPEVIFEQLSVIYAIPSMYQAHVMAVSVGCGSGLMVYTHAFTDSSRITTHTWMHWRMDLVERLSVHGPGWSGKAKSGEKYLARSFTLILPYFPTATMERVDTEGQIATAKTLATLLSSMPLTARGPAQVVVFDIHALQERFYFSDAVIPRLESAIPLLQRELQRLDSADKLAIAYPDEGAFKRFHSMFEGVPQIICFKRREGNKRIVKIKEGDPTGCHVVIVDDLVQTGGTLIESAKALLNHGASHISAYVTHPVFPKNSWQRFTDCDVKFENFWITDSIPHAKQIAQHAPFKLLTIADVIADVLLGYDLQQ